MDIIFTTERLPKVAGPTPYEEGYLCSAGHESKKRCKYETGTLARQVWLEGYLDYRWDVDVREEMMSGIRQPSMDELKSSKSNHQL